MISESEIIELKKNTKFSLEPFGETINFSRDRMSMFVTTVLKNLAIPVWRNPR
jgi:hypothetical protein